MKIKARVILIHNGVEYKGKFYEHDTTEYVDQFIEGIYDSINGIDKFKVELEDNSVIVVPENVLKNSIFKIERNLI